MRYLKKVIRELNKYFKNKQEIKYKKLEVSVLKIPLQVMFSKTLETT